MPIDTNAVKIGISSRIDLRGYSGLDLFSQGALGATTVAPAWSGKAGLFRDWIDALVGHGTELSLGDDLDAQWQADGGDPLTDPITIDEDGYVRVINNCGNGDSLTLLASDDNLVWGLPSAGFTIADGVTYTGVAYPNGLTGGSVGGTPPYMTFQRNVGTTFVVPTTPCHFSDVRLSLRTRVDSGGDIDFSGNTPPSECIEALDNDLTDAISRRVRWALTTDSPVRIVRMVDRSVTDAAEALSWENDSFRQLLGFSGDELISLTGATSRDVYYQVADLPPLGLIVPSLTRDSLTPGSKSEVRKRMTRDNRTFFHVSRQQGKWTIRFRLDGPADIDDLHRAWADQTFSMLCGGYMCLFMRWGDSRRMRTIRAGGHSDLYTSQSDGYRGRLYGTLEQDESNVDWPESLMTSAPIEITVWTAKQETAST